MEPRKKVKSRVYGIDHHDSHWEVQEWHLDIRQFHIYLTGEDVNYQSGDNDREEPGVEYKMSARFIKNLHILSQIDPRRPILIHMKTTGGDWIEGIAIYDTIKLCTNPITILSYTHARSMSSIILQAADRRLLMPHSYFLFHEGSDGFSGTNKAFRSYAKWGEKTENIMLDIYTERLKQKGKYSRRAPDRIREILKQEMDTKEDVYLTAREAVEWGFADEVFWGNWASLTKFSKKFKKQITPV